MHEEEQKPLNKVRFLAAFQKLPDNKMIVLSKAERIQSELLTVDVDKYLRDYRYRTEQAGKYKMCQPIYVVLSVDEVIRVWRFGDKFVSSQARNLKEVTSEMPPKVLECLSKTEQLILLSMKKVELMKQLIPSILADKMEEVTDEA